MRRTRGAVGCPVCAAPLAMGSVTCRGLRRLRMNEMRRTRGGVGYPVCAALPAMSSVTCCGLNMHLNFRYHLE